LCRGLPTTTPVATEGLPIVPETLAQTISGVR